MSLVVIRPPADRPEDDLRLTQILSQALHGIPHRLIERAGDLKQLQHTLVLFALCVGPVGINTAYLSMLGHIRREPQLFLGCTACMIVDGASELYTKSVATELAFSANQAGCAFVGRPLVEATGSLQNFRVQALQHGCDLLTAYALAARDSLQRLLGHHPPRTQNPNLLVLHASSRQVSNTLDLWSYVASRLEPWANIREIGLRSGTLVDCSGCAYTTCLHFGEQGGCFYGGVISEEVYPAVRWADALVLLCPNYNDALSANLTAFINRLTALFRQTRFYDKSLFSIVVSGYSGNDLLARQLIGALNMNKSFYLPGCSAFLETANAPGEALSVPGIYDRLDHFSDHIKKTLTGDDLYGTIDQPAQHR